jgi:hypothetical protein
MALKTYLNVLYSGSFEYSIIADLFQPFYAEHQKIASTEVESFGAILAMVFEASSPISSNMQISSDMASILHRTLITIREMNLIAAPQLTSKTQRN